MKQTNPISVKISQNGNGEATFKEKDGTWYTLLMNLKEGVTSTSGLSRGQLFTLSAAIETVFDDAREDFRNTKHKKWHKNWIIEPDGTVVKKIVPAVFVGGENREIKTSMEKKQ